MSTCILDTVLQLYVLENSTTQYRFEDVVYSIRTLPVQYEQFISTVLFFSTCSTCTRLLLYAGSTVPVVEVVLLVLLYLVVEYIQVFE